MLLHSFLLFLLPFVAALPQGIKTQGGPDKTPTPISFSFGVTVPVVEGAKKAPSIKYGGYRFNLPVRALRGDLVAFYGNFDKNDTISSQLTTTSTSTSVEGSDVSYTNGSAYADTKQIITLTYSSGDAARWVPSKPCISDRSLTSFIALWQELKLHLETPKPPPQPHHPATPTPQQRQSRTQWALSPSPPGRKWTMLQTLSPLQTSKRPSRQHHAQPMRMAHQRRLNT